jgi:1-acyl-sn-glycerol-3-phosphate acyltransferase
MPRLVSGRALFFNWISRISIFTTVGQVAKGVSALVVITASTIVLTVALCVLSISKFLVPEGAARDWVRRFLAGIAETWILINNMLFSILRLTRWDIEIPQGLNRKGCYLVNSNHQSWVDVVVLQRSFYRRLPFFRFFLKDSLIWVPFLGIAWWALDMPFMRRVSPRQMKRRPGLKGKDLESARKACEKFHNISVAMMNFPEGTRFSNDKRDRGKSPYRNLLVPRIGGTGQVLYALGTQLDALIDVTIVYPQRGEDGTAPTFWHLVSGQIPRIVVRARQCEIPQHLLGRNFRTDPEFRRDLESWANQLWLEKDDFIMQLRQPETLESWSSK